ncbi:hypothetical protein [Caenispirillum salinarum]|uniref:hypothetical protein n=1 Tax=Caenispirillum salinarum TaxID=859058 RepID=UPI0005B87A27|nr:hypothetical protein [Caenispirillum salinarum]
MSVRDWLRAELPTLRRHAYLFIGEKTKADDAVLLTIQQFQAEEAEPDRRRLHHILHCCIEYYEGPHADADPKLFDAGLFRLTRIQRKLLLLVSLDRLTVADAAEIVGLTRRDAERELAAARHLLGAQPVVGR